MAKKPSVNLPSYTGNSVADQAAQAALHSAQANLGATTGQSGTLTSNVYFSKNAGINNSTIGLKGPDGKLLPPIITAAQLQDALLDKQNANAYTNIYNQIAQQYPVALSGLSAGDKIPGHATVKSVQAIIDTYKTGYGLSDGKTPLELNGMLTSLSNPQSQNPYLVPSTISQQTYDQPNVQASRNVINNVFMDLLGRTASDQDVQKYTQQYLQYAAQNPTSNTQGQNTYNLLTGIPTASGGTSNRLFKGSQQEQSVTNNLTEQAFVQNAIQQSTDFKAMSAANTAFNFLKNIAVQSEGTV